MAISFLRGKLSFTPLHPALTLGAGIRRKTMKTTRWLIACIALAVFLLPLYVTAEDVPLADNAAQEAFMQRITEEGTPYPGMFKNRDPMYTPEKVRELLDSYASPADFMKELSAAWMSENEELRYTALQFTINNRKDIPLEESHWQQLLGVVERWPDEGYFAAMILVEGSRPEGLEIARRWLAEKETDLVEEGMYLLVSGEPPLAEEDVVRLLELLKRDLAAKNAQMLGFDCSYVWRIPLAERVLDMLAEIGLLGRAMPVVMEHLVWPEPLTAYDEAKFAAFLAGVKKPDLTVDEFWQLVEAAGFRLDETQCGNRPEDEDIDIDVEEGEEEEFIDPYVTIKEPWSADELRDYFTWSPQLAHLVRQTEPDSSRWQFLLVQACLENRTNTATGESQKYVRHYLPSFAGINELRPFIDFIRKHPEVVVSDGAKRNPDAAAWESLDTNYVRYEAIMAAMLCNLTPAQRQEYIEAARAIYQQTEDEVLQRSKAYLRDALEQQREKQPEREP